MAGQAGCAQPRRLAEAATAAANRQHTTVTGQAAAAMIVSRLAADILRLHAEVEVADKVIEHKHAEILLSVLGFGLLLAAHCGASRRPPTIHCSS